MPSVMQGSPTATHDLNALQRSPPNSRFLPSSPRSERETTPPHPHNAPNVYYPRPINRVAPLQFLTELDMDHSTVHLYEDHPYNIWQEQLARQWQEYAQNQSALAGEHVSDSTFSPAATPFQGNITSYNPWAYLLTNRTLGGDGSEARARRVPIPPPVGVRKKGRKKGRRLNAQMRSTPEPDSSEETAGESEETQTSTEIIRPDHALRGVQQQLSYDVVTVDAGLQHQGVMSLHLHDICAVIERLDKLFHLEKESYTKFLACRGASAQQLLDLLQDLLDYDVGPAAVNRRRLFKILDSSISPEYEGVRGRHVLSGMWTASGRRWSRSRRSPFVKNQIVSMPK
ncbi:hypothetical protein C8J57DRAFT_1533565 [Mycena rebaudengoi]|nr:hypothetical protein C8J57DRAFT_1533565 [Mycena rebaudengoi]